ncbi:uncharacterized protein [Typha latifolia]|uniref:uncharacterized protein isoform X2 n=1 Tax=Typha latifolia TaxID=4733 RepID=UPI003C2B6911
MVANKVDLPEDLIPSKLAEEARAAKDDTTVENGDGKGLAGILAETIDKLMPENNIPLSPQWLYSRPNESKDMHRSNFLPRGTSFDCHQKDNLALDGSLGMKDGRQIGPDVENNHSWHEEERETNLLSRRDRRKEGDRENGYCKNEHCFDSAPVKEMTDSRNLSFEQWLDANNCIVGNESRWDSKWSSRWGPEGKEKDTRIDRKLDADREDTTDEKQYIPGSNRTASESDSRDKWRPRHRQEVPSCGSSVYHSAPGYGLQGGRGEGANVGFAPGRGRSNVLETSVFKRSSRSHPIGAAYGHEKSSLSAETFCYPRAKLLDVYRKNQALSSFDSTPEGFEEVPPITISSSIAPLAFTTPDADEEDILENMCKVNTNGSDICNNLCRNADRRVNSSTADRTSILGEYRGKTNAYNDEDDRGFVTPSNSKNDAYYNIRDLANKYTDTKYELEVGVPVRNSDEIVDPSGAFPKNANENINSPNSFNGIPNIPLDSSSLLDESFISEHPSRKEQDGTNNDEVKISEQGDEVKMSEQSVPPKELSLFYLDPHGEIQGPFLGVDITSWFERGYFGTDLPVRLSGAPEGANFQQLGDVMPHLKDKVQAVYVPYVNDQSQMSVAAGGNLETSTIPADISSSTSVNSQQLATTDFMDSLDRQDQQCTFEHHDFRNSDDRWLHHPEFETLAGISTAQRQNFHELSQEEGVLCPGMPVMSTENILGKSFDNLHLPYTTTSGSPSLAGGMEEMKITDQMVPADNELNRFGLLLSELEGTHLRHPLSSNICNTTDQNMANLAVGGEASFSGQKHKSLNSALNFSGNDASLTNGRRNTSSNVLQNFMDASLFSHSELDSDHCRLEEHLLSQQLQSRQLRQHHLLFPQQTMHADRKLLDKAEGSIRHQQFIRRAIPDIELQLHHQKQQQVQFHHQKMQLLQQYQHHQQQRLQQQLLVEQLRNQQLLDAGFGQSYMDTRQPNSVLDQYLCRQKLLRELQDQSHHLSQQHGFSLEQLIQAGYRYHDERQNDRLDVLSHPRNKHILPLEEQVLLDIQQQQLLAHQVSMKSKQMARIEEQRHSGRVWPVGESDQFSQTAFHPPHSQGNGFGQLDFLEQHQRSLSLNQRSYLEQVSMMHGGLQQGNIEPNLQFFDRSISLSTRNPESNNDLAHVIAHQGLNVQEESGRMYPSDKVMQFPSERQLYQHQNSHQFAPHLDAIRGQQIAFSGQLPLVESRFNQLHLELQQQKRDMNKGFSLGDEEAWSSLARENENLMNGLDLFHHKQVNQISQTLGMAKGASISSYGIREPARLLSDYAADNHVARKSYDTDSFVELNHFSQSEKTLQQSLANIDVKEHANNIANRELDIQMSHGLSNEFEPLDMVKLGKYGHGDYIGRNISLSDLRDRKRNNLGEDSLMDHRDLNDNTLIRPASFDSIGGSLGSYGYGLEDDIAYDKSMSNDRISGILLEGMDESSLKRAHASHATSSQVSSLATVSAPFPIKGKGPVSLATSDGGQEHEGNAKVLETSARSKSNARFHGDYSYGDRDPPEASFVDMLKKPAVTEAVVSTGTADSTDSSTVGKSGKKKGKKGRQIDPSLLGFKVHSNRIMMGEIHRPGDFI